MIRYIKQNDIDYRKWDECVNNSINNIIYAQSWYLDKAAGQWDALVEDDYMSVMPLPFKKKFNIHKVYTPIFTQQLGVFSKKIISEELVKNFIDAIPPKFRIIDLNLNCMNKLYDKSIIKQHRITHLLDLVEPYENIQKSYSQNAKQNIKKAQKNNLFITEDGGHDEIIYAFRDNKGKQYSTIKDSDYNKLNHIIYSAINKGIAKIIKAYDGNNNFCAGVVFLIHNNRAIFIFSGSTPEARENRAMFLIVDYFIRKYQQTNITLDFEGSMDKNLSRFFRGFGAKECLFLRIKKYQLPIISRYLYKNK